MHSQLLCRSIHFFEKPTVILFFFVRTWWILLKNTSSPNCNSDAGVIATWKHESIVKILQSIVFPFWYLCRSSTNAWLKLPNTNLLIFGIECKPIADFQGHNASHYLGQRSNFHWVSAVIRSQNFMAMGKSLPLPIIKLFVPNWWEESFFSGARAKLRLIDYIASRSYIGRGNKRLCILFIYLFF